MGGKKEYIEMFGSFTEPFNYDHRYMMPSHHGGRRGITSSTVDTARPQMKGASKEQLEKKSGVRNEDSRIQLHLEEDGGGGLRQKCMDFWTVAYVLLAATRHKSSK